MASPLPVKFTVQRAHVLHALDIIVSSHLRLLPSPHFLLSIAYPQVELQCLMLSAFLLTKGSDISGSGCPASINASDLQAGFLQAVLQIQITL
jgi:hypothetical protein